MPSDGLRQPAETRRRILPLGQEDRGDLAGHVVERDDQVPILRRIGQPGMGRAILSQQHARQRPALALLAMHAAQGGLALQPRRLQRRRGAKGVTK